MDDEHQKLKDELDHLRKSLEYQAARHKPDAVAREMFDNWVKRVSVVMKEEADKVRQAHSSGYFG